MGPFFLCGTHVMFVRFLSSGVEHDLLLILVAHLVKLHFYEQSSRWKIPENAQLMCLATARQKTQLGHVDGASTRHQCHHCL